jgi:asparagine synthase (glutamine-hydrolysing)
MLLTGDMGRNQVDRRQELIQKFNATDHTVDAIAFPPLTSKGSRWHHKKIWAYDEPYSEALESMLSIAISNDNSIILTGIGGDELVLPDWFEVEDYHKNAEGKKNHFLNDSMFHTTGYMPNFVREFCIDAEISTPAAPKPIIPESALMASRCRAPVFLRNGIWPINPLCTPELVNYCHSLPLSWRAKKYLHRKLFLEHGISENTVYPKIRENFSGIMAYTVFTHSKQLIKNLLSSLIISELGLIDGKKIMCEHDNFLDNKATHNPGIFYDICILELTVRSVAGKI